MFKKLRNKFLLLNLIIISIMMLIAFISIYLILYNTIRSDIEDEMHKIAGFAFSNYPPPSPSSIPPPSGDKMKPPPPLWDQSVCFTFFTDSSFAIQSVSSAFNAEREFYEAAKELALSKNTNSGLSEMDSLCKI